jgi:hypothetical protein
MRIGWMMHVVLRHSCSASNGPADSGATPKRGKPHLPRPSGVVWRSVVTGPSSYGEQSVVTARPMTVTTAIRLVYHTLSNLRNLLRAVVYPLLRGAGCLGGGLRHIVQIPPSGRHGRGQAQLLPGHRARGMLADSSPPPMLVVMTSVICACNHRVLRCDGRRLDRTVRVKPSATARPAAG